MIGSAPENEPATATVVCAIGIIDPSPQSQAATRHTKLVIINEDHSEYVYWKPIRVNIMQYLTNKLH